MKMNSINLLIILFVVSFVDSIKRDKIIACNYNVDKGPPSVIDANLCTHLLVNGFLTMDSAPHHLVFKNYERNKKILDRLKGLKSQNPYLKIIGSVECYGIECYFEKVVTTSEKITKFVKSAINLMREHKLNGLHLGWRYPVCLRGNCTYKTLGQKDGFSDLLSELKLGLSNKETLSATVYPDDWVSDHIYDFETMKRLDFLTLWNFDKRGPWREKAEHHGLVERVKDSLEYWANKGVNKNKILAGIAFYGIEVKLENEDDHEYWGKIDRNDSPIQWPPPESFYQSKHIIPYNQICQHINKTDGWKQGIERQDTHPYAYKGKRWVSFESPTSAANKAKLVLTEGFGGVWVREITQDDIDAKCSLGDRPLLREIAKKLFN